MRRRLVTAASAAAVLVLPAQALAHGTLQWSSPSYGQRLERAPARITLRFDESMTLLPGRVRVLDIKGRSLAGAARLQGPRTISAPLRPLARGGYTVRWQALSRDGHIVSGVFTFGVRQRAPVVTAAFGATGPSAVEDVVRWLAFAALALVLGGLGFRLLVLGEPVAPRFERAFYIVVLVGAVGVLEVGLAAFLLRADAALQLPFGEFLYGDLTPIAHTAFGAAFAAMTLGFVVVTALVFLGWLTRRPALLWAAFAVALLFASGFSLSGHSAAEPNSSSWSKLADWAHLSAASLWAGGLVMLLVLLLTAPERGRAAFSAFAKLAPVLIAVLVAAGTYLSFLRLAQPSDLWTTGYGRVLTVKLSLVALALAWGAFHHFIVEPRLERPGALSRLPRSLAGEAAVGMAVLLLAAILVNSKPPSPASGVTGTPAAVQRTP